MIAKLISIALLVGLFSGFVEAQDRSDSLLYQFYGEALNHIDKKNFEKADESFKKVFSLKTTMPDELAYFYGYTQLNLFNFKKGREFLQKYLELRGDTGRFSSYASTYLNYADCQEFGNYKVKEICNACDGHGTAQAECPTCQGKGREICDLCGSIGLIKKRDQFGESFATCTKCTGMGFFTCTNCKGALNITRNCFLCDGKGSVYIKKDCDATIIAPN